MRVLASVQMNGQGRARRGAVLWGFLVGAGCSADTQPLVANGLLDAGSVDVSVDASSSVADVGLVAADSGFEASDASVPDVGTPLSPIGGPCESGADCQSNLSPYIGLYPQACVPVAENWAGGYCVDYCVLPADPFVPPRLVRADCPSGAVCLPRSVTPGQFPRDDIGACLKECQVDSDCRTEEGYYCRRDFFRANGPVTFDNGYCAPSHCQTRGCPSSFLCQC